MKKGIHPDYFQTAIHCACGNVVEAGSTKKDIRVEICSQCHPFFTGKQKLVDTAGRIERFRKKYAKFEDNKNAGGSLKHNLDTQPGQAGPQKGKQDLPPTKHENT